MSQQDQEVFDRLSRTDPPARPVRRMDTAVVLGGSIAGLLSARVLADHAESVVVVERDDLAGDQRPGVPHGRQLHVLAPGGRRQIERWFPGFTEQAVRLGARPISGARSLSFLDGAPEVAALDVEILSASRAFLERLLRERTLALPNVRWVTGRVVGLDFDADAVTGVRYLAGEQEHHQPAALVADAMGRASKVSDWLEAAGWQRPALRRMSIGVNYATGYFRGRAPEFGPLSCVARYSPANPSSIAVAAVSAIEDDRWMVLLAGYGKDRPGRDAEEFVGRCKSELPALFGEVAGGERIGEIRTYRQADNRRRDLHRARLPARLVSVGDAVASFNPVYGQGMSSAALQVSALAAYLETGPTLSEPAREFFDMQRVVVDAAWDTSTAADAARIDPHRALPLAARLRRWLDAQKVTAARIDPVVSRRFYAVASMLRHPAHLATPYVVARALAVNLLKRPSLGPAHR